MKGNKLMNKQPTEWVSDESSQNWKSIIIVVVNVVVAVATTAAAVDVFAVVAFFSITKRFCLEWTMCRR